MGRLHLWMCTAGVLLACFAAPAMALAQNANGKELYRNNCRVCHEKGSANGQYTPMTLTQDQWRAFFKLKLTPAHQTAVNPKTGGQLLEQLSPDQFKAIQRFCIDHAADSEQPATCG